MRKISEKAEKLRTLLEELNAINAELTAAYAEFNRATDQSLIESAVYAVNGLHSRYDFVLRQIKALPDSDAESAENRVSVYSKYRQLSIE
ncbi:MAG: DUF2508 family protein [Oscillospiraceae bacterium]|jgi:hypothetical protein|nr:DUF2508 family protein [Oscillospiraceae bacterium]